MPTRLFLDGPLDAGLFPQALEDHHGADGDRFCGNIALTRQDQHGLFGKP
ncbi:hypothetical protein [Desulfomarina sp.]